jgi:L-ribulose-5-phosphate 3-epimerase UlaE
VRAASDATGLKIYSVMNEAHWKFPLSSGDPEVVRQSVARARVRRSPSMTVSHA